MSCDNGDEDGEGRLGRVSPSSQERAAHSAPAAQACARSVVAAAAAIRHAGVRAGKLRPSMSGRLVPKPTHRPKSSATATTSHGRTFTMTCSAATTTADAAISRAGDERRRDSQRRRGQQSDRLSGEHESDEARRGSVAA